MNKEVHPAAVEFGNAFVKNASPQFKTQTQLAEALQVSRSLISKIGNGTRIPSPVIVGKYLETIPLSYDQMDQIITPYSKLLEGNLVHESHINNSVEARRRMSEARKGKTHSVEARRWISDALKGKTRSEETRRRISEANKGKTRSEETRRRISKAKKGIPSPMKGKTRSEETRRRIGEGVRSAAERRKLAKLTPLEPGVETFLEA